jgi:pantoate--beta-alanine ligase
MKVLDSIYSLREHLDKEAGGLLGFVPTMGALHEGHLSLVRESCRKSALTVVSIFVNPTQFNKPEDLKKYPRNIQHDMTLLEDILSDRDILFIPSYDDLYSREKEFSLDLDGLDRVMEGRHRPGHFEGVVRVVKLLFEVVQPDLAFFGQKDFQQLTIIKKMVDKLKMNITIIACPILRESHGLAMSSRNERLDPGIREKAKIIYSTLKRHSNINSLSEILSLEQRIISEINESGNFQTEYFEIVDNVSLAKLTPGSELSHKRKYYGCIAVFADKIRLIDNIEFSFEFIKG